MAIDQAILGQRLRSAREALGITQENAAGALGLPRTAIVQIEGGSRAVSSLELMKLAKLYRRDVSDFFAEEMTMEDPCVVLHRLAPGLEQTHPEVDRQVRHCLEICKAGTELEQLLSRPARSGPPTYVLPTPRNAGEAVVQGVQIAAQERQRLGIADAPLADIAELLNNQGIWASAVELPDEMSGLFLSHSTLGMVILVNQFHNEQRKRFSYAHEYGHSLFDRDYGKEGTVSTKENSPDLREKRANAFAAAFLLPAGGVRQLLLSMYKGQPSRLEQAVFDVATEGRIDAEVRPAPGSQTVGYQDVAMIARSFNTSYQAALFRLRSLDCITQKACEELLQQDQLAANYSNFLEVLRQGEAKPQQKQDRELIPQIVRLVMEAFRQDEISRGRVLELADILGVSGRELLDLAQASKAA